MQLLVNFHKLFVLSALLVERGSRCGGQIVIEVEVQEFLGRFNQVREFCLKDILLASEVVVQDGLLLQVVLQLPPNLVRLVDPLTDVRVPCLEIVQSGVLLDQVF